MNNLTSLPTNSPTKRKKLLLSPISIDNKNSEKDASLGSGSSMGSATSPFNIILTQNQISNKCDFLSEKFGLKVVEDGDDKVIFKEIFKDAMSPPQKREEQETRKMFDKETGSLITIVHCEKNRGKPKGAPKVSRSLDRTAFKGIDLNDISINQIIKGNAASPLEICIKDLVKVKPLGQGTSGFVEEVVHKPTRTKIAMKSIPLQTNEAIKKQILLELQTLHDCDSNYIVRSYGAFMQQGNINIALEYMNVGSLQKIIKTVGKIPEGILGQITVQILKGLEYLHKTMKVIHRDIKPSNILLNRKGEVKIADFGVSGKLENTLDCKNTFVGTVIYMSPERLRGESYFSDTDLWSLGLMLVECATGKFPYARKEGEDEPLDFWKLLAETIETSPIPELPKEDFTPEFCNFISICLNKNPSIRKTATELLEHPFIRKIQKLNTTYLKGWIKTV